MSRRPSPRRLPSVAIIVAGAVAGIVPLASRARAEEPATGFYLAAAVAGAAHRDIAVLDWTDPAKTYIDLDLALRLGAAWRGAAGGVLLEHGAMIGRPGASYIGGFGGYGAPVSRRLIVEVAGEVGLHVFHDVGALVGNYDVVRENGAQLPFWGVRATAAWSPARWRWQPALFVALRTDVGRANVSSDLRMTCPSVIFPDGPECHEGASSSARSSVGGATVFAGFELRRIFRPATTESSGRAQE